MRLHCSTIGSTLIDATNGQIFMRNKSHKTGNAFPLCGWRCMSYVKVLEGYRASFTQINGSEAWCSRIGRSFSIGGGKIL